MPNEREPIERLLAELAEVTERAQKLASEVKKALQGDRGVGRPVGPAKAVPAPKGRRRLRDRRQQPEDVD